VLFSDVSLHPQLRRGVGGCLLVPAAFLEVSPHSIESSKVDKHLVVRRFEGSSSTRLEVLTALWALEDYQNILKASGAGKLRVYTDSQCLAGLLKRRPGLVANGFLSKKTNSLLRNAPLYRRFYELFDELEFEVIKVAGHSRSCSRDTIHCIFSSVDREVRKELKLWINGFEIEGIEPTIMKPAARTIGVDEGVV
jgi:ribonuclease HI